MYVSFDFPQPTPELKSRSDIAMRPNRLHSRCQCLNSRKILRNLQKNKIREKRIMVIGGCKRQVCGKC